MSADPKRWDLQRGELCRTLPKGIIPNNSFFLILFLFYCHFFSGFVSTGACWGGVWEAVGVAQSKVGILGSFSPPGTFPALGQRTRLLLPRAFTLPRHESRLVEKAADSCLDLLALEEPQAQVTPASLLSISTSEQSWVWKGKMLCMIKRTP